MGRRHRATRRARAALLWGGAFFLLAQLALALAVHSRLPQVRDPRYGVQVSHLRQRLASAPVRPLSVVMLGSSRAQWAFRAAAVEDALASSPDGPVLAYNLATPAAGPVVGLLRLGQLCRAGVRPDLVLIEVLPAFLSAGPERFEGGPPTEQLQWGDLGLLRRHARRPGLHRDWITGQAVPWYTYRKSLLLHLAPRLLPAGVCHAEGPLALDRCGTPAVHPRGVTPEARARALEHARREYRANLQSFRIGGQGCQALREMLQTCRRENLAAALVLLPEGPEFRSWYPPQTWAGIAEFLDGLGSEFGVPVVNAREWLAEEEFLDSHHLLARGAAGFTDRLTREVLRPRLGALRKRTPFNPGPVPVATSPPAPATGG